jgi:hypothetical protein
MAVRLHGVRGRAPSAAVRPGTAEQNQNVRHGGPNIGEARSRHRGRSNGGQPTTLLAAQDPEFGDQIACLRQRGSLAHLMAIKAGAPTRDHPDECFNGKQAA